MPRQKKTDSPASVKAGDAIASIKYPAKRKNLPPAGLEAQGRIQETPRVRYAYNPHLPSLLRSATEATEADQLPALLATALTGIFPQANRWDFAIGYQHADRQAEVIHWTELHTASDGEVKVVIAKAQWLLGWLKAGGKDLAKFEREMVWVSSGGITFTLTSPKMKQMAAAGRRHVGSRLRIRNQRG